MPYYETIFETGAHSLACYDDDAEAASAVKAHHARATEGRAGGPSGNPAERIVKVLKYQNHPATLGEDQSLSAEVAKSALADALKACTDDDGVVSVPELAAAVRDLTNPLYEDSEPHDSNYKMESEGELSWQ